uniref:Cytochrome P450 18a1-like n=2 Tax=Hirondellea gigas TaxID=1518452 RepID=A0A2P2I1V8_9CRUS
MVVHYLLYETSVSFQCAFILSIIYSLIWLKNKLTANLPPGPWGIPGFGYLPFIREETHMAMYKLSQKFGDVFSITLGQRVFVVLSDPTVIREAFNQSAFSGRPMTPLYGMFNGFGVVNTRGKMWKDERRFLHQKLIKHGMKKFGSGREKMEAKIHTEVHDLLISIQREEGRPLCPEKLLTALATNVITSFMTSTRFDANDPIFLKHKEINSEGFKLFAKLDMVNYIWAMKFLPSVKKDMRKLAANHSESMNFFRNVINERRSTFKPNDDKDILDAYLQVEYEREDEIINFDVQVAQVLCDLVSAGSESAKTTLSWVLLYLLHNQDVVQKMRDEIDEHVNKTRLPNMSDQEKLVYCQATINEVLRIANVTPIAPNHATEKSLTLRGYNIPKGSSVVALLYACHMNPKYWDDPEDFRPERFINEEGRLSIQKAFIPFGKGQRNCLGDTLAQTEIFLVITALIQNFSLENPPNTPLPTKKGILGATHAPVNFDICFKVRSDCFIFRHRKERLATRTA